MVYRLTFIWFWFCKCVCVWFGFCLDPNNPPSMPPIIPDPWSCFRVLDLKSVFLKYFFFFFENCIYEIKRFNKWRNWNYGGVCQQTHHITNTLRGFIIIFEDCGFWKIFIFWKTITKNFNNFHNKLYFSKHTIFDFQIYMIEFKIYGHATFSKDTNLL